MKFVVCPRNCFDGCMFAYDKGILLPRKDHPGVDGITCPKSRFIVDVVHHEERIRRPLLKTKHGYEEITIDVALDIIARKIEQKDRVVRIDYSGNMMLLSRYYHHRLFHVLKSPDIRWDICAEAGSDGLRRSWGVGYGMDLVDMKGSDVVFIWGANVHQTSVHAFTYAMQTKQSGGKVFVIDVMKSETAKWFDLIRVNPGGDVAFALQIMKILQEEGYNVPVDISLSTTELSSLSGVDNEVALDVVHVLKGAKRPFIFMGYGFQRRRNGGMAVRLISLLPYITHRKPLFYYDRPSYGVDKDYVSGKHLATGEVYSLTQMAKHIQPLEKTVFVVMNANPVSTLPRGDIIEEVFDRPSNFTVVHDLFMTDTAKHADLIIPAAASMEYEDIMITYGHKYVGLNEKVFNSPEHAINNMDLARQLARRLSLPQPELYEDDWSVIEHVLTKAGIDITLLKRQGYAPLPDIPIFEEPIFPSWDEIAPNVEVRNTSQKFMLLTPSYRYRIHSQYWLFDKTEDEIWISPSDAERLDIDNGESVIVENEGGRLICKASIKADIPQGIVRIFHGNWGSKLSALMPLKMSNYGPNSTISDTWVDVKKYRD